MPGWELPDPNVEFLFVREGDSSVGGTLDPEIDALMKRFVATGSFRAPSYRVVSLTDMTASLYVLSVPLDLDYLSPSTKRSAARKS